MMHISIEQRMANCESQVGQKQESICNLSAKPASHLAVNHMALLKTQV